MSFSPEAAIKACQELGKRSHGTRSKLDISKRVEFRL